MAKDKVVFRVIKKEVVAFFPNEPANRGNILSYAHIGQHSEASKAYYKSGRLAKPTEYTSLKRELKNIGYNI